MIQSEGFRDSQVLQNLKAIHKQVCTEQGSGYADHSCLLEPSVLAMLEFMRDLVVRKLERPWIPAESQGYPQALILRECVWTLYAAVLRWNDFVCAKDMVKGLGMP